MNWKFHRGYGAFLMGLGAVSVAIGACGMEGPGGVSDTGCDFNCTAAGSGGAGGVTGVGGDFSGGAAGAPLAAEADGFVPSDAGTDGTTSADGGGSNGDDGGAPEAGSPPPIPNSCLKESMQPKVFWVSADDSNSMGSPGLVREIISLGFEPNPARVRTYEFLNYYRIGYLAAPQDTLSIFPEMEKTVDPMTADFQFAIRSHDTISRRAMNFTFLIDTSGSMKGPGIQRARWAVKAIASQFITGDIVNVVTTDAMSKVLEHHSVTGKDDMTLVNLVDGLTTGGTTNLSTAFTLAYDLADDNIADNRMSRVIFISDGGANVGVTETDLITKQSADAQSEGLYLVGIGTGPALTYDDYLMNGVTDAGRGAYVYIDSEEEANRVLRDRFDETMDIAARSVQVQVTLPWYFQFNAISVEQQGQKKLKPQYLAPNDAMVFFLQTHACDPSVYNWEDPVGIKVLWNTRDNNAPQTTEITRSLKSLFGAEPSLTMARGRAIVAYAEALKGCGVDENGFSLCKSETERRATIKEKLLVARDLATKAKNEPVDHDLDEIIGLIDIHPLIKP